MEAKVGLDPSRMSPHEVYNLLSGSVVPRPIGFISTAAADGVANVAPFSYFNAISGSPPMVCFAPDRRDAARPKDTLRNVLATGEFVFNLVDEALAAAQSVCSEDFPAEVDEFQIAGLTPVPSRFVKPPRVAESPVNLECKLVQSVALPESTYTLVIGKVVCFHVRKDVYLANGRIDFGRLKAVGRMAGGTYSRTRELFRLEH